MLDLKRRGPDVRRFVATLEEWIIRTLAAFNVAGERREDRVGVWVRRPDKGAGHEDKIAAIGIRVKRWVTLHGIALNVDCDLTHFAGIVPCGVTEPRYGVTSLADLGLPASMPDVDIALRREFEPLFGATAVGAGDPAARDARSGRRLPRRSSATAIWRALPCASCTAPAFGWQAMPIFEQTGAPSLPRPQARQPSIHCWQVVSTSP